MSSSGLNLPWIMLVGLLAGCAELQGPPPPAGYPVQSFEEGVGALVSASERWRADRGCVTCHTNGWGLAAQPVIAPDSPEVAAGRAFARDYLQRQLQDWASSGDARAGVEGQVATAAFLAMSDARSGRSAQAVTLLGLDQAWALLDESGTWEGWLQCNWPPFESDAEFGPALVLVALGELSATTALRASDLEGARRLAEHLRRTPALGLHDKAMRLWAASAWPEVAPEDEQRAWRGQLLAAQAADGGWSMASLAGPRWRREDGEEQLTASEAYPTAFVTYVLLQTGATPRDAAVQAGLRWLREHQRPDGAWFTRSPRRDGKHYISRAATAFALMALVEGGAVAVSKQR